jgi:RNA polymerase sigma-70 factor (ECF subfamily)
LAPLSASDDEHLAGLAADGDLGAFEALVVRHGSAVVAALERLLGGDHHGALDGAQEVWVKVHRALPGYRRGANFRSWLFAIALNHGRDCRRRVVRRARFSGDELAFAGRLDGSTDGRDPSERATERGAIAAALTAVDERFREALVLVDGLGFGYDEAALALRCAVGTVKSRVHRGRESFRAAYERMDSSTESKSPRPPAVAAASEWPGSRR